MCGCTSAFRSASARSRSRCSSAACSSPTRAGEAARGGPLDQMRGRMQPVACPDRLTGLGEGAPQSRIAEQTADRAVELGVGEAVRAEPDAVTQFGHALGVVVLVPEQRQQDHGLAEVEGLGRRVVAAVRDSACFSPVAPPPRYRTKNQRGSCADELRGRTSPSTAQEPRTLRGPALSPGQWPLRERSMSPLCHSCPSRGPLVPLRSVSRMSRRRRSFRPPCHVSNGRRTAPSRPQTSACRTWPKRSGAVTSSAYIR